MAMAWRHSFGWYPSTQFGARPNSSTIDAIMTYVHDVEAARNHGMVTSVLMFDISGYFDNVNHNRLIHEMRRKRIPLQLVKWTASFLTDRQAAICLDGIRGEMEPISTGIPQGSPASPVISNIYAAPLLERIKQGERHLAPLFVLPDKPTNPTLSMFVDDGKLTVSSLSLDTNVRILQRAYQITNNWLTSVGLASAPDKLELIHHSWQRDKGHAPDILVPGPTGTPITCKASKTVRWLGATFDHKLTFDQHVANLANRATITVRGACMLANTVKGLHQTHLRTLYQACALPVLTYASPAWWKGKKTHIAVLSKVQNDALRHMCATFKTTPIAAMEIAAAIPPIELTLNLNNDRYAHRLHKLYPANPVKQRLPLEWRNGTEPTHPPQLPIQKATK